MSGTADNASAVPRPNFTSKGFVAPQESAILDGVRADVNSAFGGDLNPADETPQGQLTTSFTAIIGDSYDRFLYYCTQVDPAFAQDRMQDAIARIYFIERYPARSTVVPCRCIGLAGTIIPAGALAQAQDRKLYAATVGGTIPESASTVLEFACTETGPIPCPAGSFSTPYRAIPGWDTVTNETDGVIGAAVESRADFEARRNRSVAKNGTGSLPAVLGSVLQVPDVLDAYAAENPKRVPVTVAGVSVPPNSLYVSVSGGDQQAIADAIWTKKSPGCDTAGNTTVTVHDTSYEPPYPAYPVSFQVATPTPVLFAVALANGAGVPSDAKQQVQRAIVSAFAGGDGGQRAHIAAAIYASRFYGPVAALGPWVQIVSIGIGIDTPTHNSVLMRMDQVPTVAPEDVSVMLVSAAS